MLKLIGTGKLRWKILALMTALFIGAMTSIDAGEKKMKKNAAEIQAKIDRLQVELQKAKEADQTDFSSVATLEEVEALKPSLPGRYIGMEGDDRIGIVIDPPKDGVYPIVFYENGLLNRGYDPTDDDQYVGTATVKFPADRGPMELKITLKQKFDGPREESVEPALRELKAKIVSQAGTNGDAIKILLPKNKEWDAVYVSKEMRESPKPTSDAAPLSAQNVNVDSLAGSYSGSEGDDKLGLILTSLKSGTGEYRVTVYEDGLLGAGHDPRDDDRYEGTAIAKNNQLEIQLTKKFDAGKEERVERVLRRLVATVQSQQEGNIEIDIPANAEWDTVHLVKSGN